MTPERGKSESGGSEPLNRNELLELYKIADANHRFYVDKRFKILSLYFPAVTSILLALYQLAPQSSLGYRIGIAFIGFVLTAFLYELERRNWTLTNICSDICRHLGYQIEGQENLHVWLKASYMVLPPYSTWLDKLIFKLAKNPTQHRAMCYLSTFLIAFWIGLLVSLLLSGWLM